jgi:P pilus assembly chaperone PapD
VSAPRFTSALISGQAAIAAASPLRWTGHDAVEAILIKQESSGVSMNIRSRQPKSRPLTHRFAWCASLLLFAQLAHAELMLFPKRIVFEDKQRAAQVELVNNGTEPATYRISLKNRRMNESGALSVIDSPGPGDMFADSMLHFSPHEVRLEPGASQTIRVLLRKPEDLAPGEYRSHLQFDKQPEVTAANSIEGPKGKSKEIGISLTMLLGASIPVIVRHGEVSATVALSQMELQGAANGQPALLSVFLERAGNKSVYGDLEVFFTPQGGSEQTLAKANGVAVYVPTPRRRVELPLQLEHGVALKNGTLRVTLREREEAGGAMITETSRQIP